MKNYTINRNGKTRSSITRLATRTFILLILASASCLTGCLTRPALNKQTFTFNALPIIITNATNNNHVLGIRRLHIAAPFDGRSFVYRTGEFSFERDPYAEFLESPADELISPISEWLRQSENFKAVVAGGSALKPDMLVEINVSQLFGDFHQPEYPAAVLVVEFVLLDATNGIPGKATFKREYSRSIPLNASTAAELMAGWNEALTQILTEFSSNLGFSEIGNQGQEFPSIINEWLHL